MNYVEYKCIQIFPFLFIHLSSVTTLSFYPGQGHCLSFILIRILKTHLAFNLHTWCQLFIFYMFALQSSNAFHTSFLSTFSTLLFIWFFFLRLINFTFTWITQIMHMTQTVVEHNTVGISVMKHPEDIRTGLEWAAAVDSLLSLCFSVWCMHWAFVTLLSPAIFL